MELLINKIMIAKGMKLKDLAEALGKTTATVSTQINGTPTIPVLEKIAKVLDVEVADFFPVPSNYVRWDEKLEQKDEVMFCPHCGTKFVVLPKEIN